MHRYRDAMVADSGATSYEHSMFGAYVLFPYHNEEEYKNHRFYKSIDKVNTGGLPFLPSATNLVTDILDQLITDSPDSAFERATLPKGIEERLARVDWSRRDVLIGTFRNKTQFEICFEKKLYYIPVSRIDENNLPIHYVAMFRIPGIFLDDVGIYHYGEVLRTAIVPCSEMPEDLSDYCNPEELYYLFEIREWKYLNRPILPKGSGFVYEFTNTFLLENAEFIPELLLKSEEEYRLYMELKRWTGQTLQSDAGFEIPDYKMYFNEGEIQIISHKKVAAACGIKEFSRHPNQMFRKLIRMINNANV